MRTTILPVLPASNRLGAFVGCGLVLEVERLPNGLLVAAWFGALRSLRVVVGKA